MPPIATLTLNPCVDKSAAVARVVAERKMRCEPPTFEPGGGGINVARAVGKLGGAATAVYLAGGPTGDVLGRLLDGEALRRDGDVVDMARSLRDGGRHAATR